MSSKENNFNINETKQTKMRVRVGFNMRNYYLSSQLAYSH